MKIIKDLERKHDLTLTHTNGNLYIDINGKVCILPKENGCILDYLKKFCRLYVFKNVEEIKKWLDGEILFPTAIIPLMSPTYFRFKYLFIYYKKYLIAVI
jgi:hypothetical protein